MPRFVSFASLSLSFNPLAARRTTLTTEVITPHQIQRRAARLTGSHAAPPTPTKGSKMSSSSTPVFRPYNVSRPSCDSHSSSVRNPPDAVQRPVVTNGVASAPGASGGLLNKLRKQFRSGRLR